MSTPTVNAAEQFVLDVCRRSFLSLWCYNNPLAKPGKELCDILVVCDPHVVVVSVKEAELKLGNQPEVECARWVRNAVDESVKQIYGAERRLRAAPHVVRGDGTPGLALPPLDRRRVHRIAVAFGGRGAVPIKSGDFGKGFVHVLSEYDFLAVLRELDTIRDLVEYLEAKERYCVEAGAIIVEGGEENLLGWYLANERAFPERRALMTVGDTVWAGYSGRPEVRRKREADRVSYVWDRLIEALCAPDCRPVGEAGWELSDVELALRTMARENRFSRRMLGAGVREFLDPRAALRSRILVGPSGVVYVVAFFKGSEGREDRVAELGTRCVLARHKVGQGHTVVGVGIGEYVPGVGSASDLVYLHLPDWTADDERMTERMKAELGHFTDAAVSRRNAREYPAEG